MIKVNTTIIKMWKVIAIDIANRKETKKSKSLLTEPHIFTLQYQFNSLKPFFLLCYYKR